MMLRYMNEPSSCHTLVDSSLGFADTVLRVGSREPAVDDRFGLACS